MALFYLETSALVKLYVREAGTERLMRLVSRPSENRLALLALAEVELRSAIRRRERAGDIASRVAEMVLDRFAQHMTTRFLRQAMSDPVLDTASVLVDRYSLRAMDAVQLAGCLILGTISGGEMPVFVCADRELLDAANSEQLPVLNPCDES